MENLIEPPNPMTNIGKSADNTPRPEPPAPAEAMASDRQTRGVERSEGPALHTRPRATS